MFINPIELIFGAFSRGRRDSNGGFFKKTGGFIAFLRWQWQVKTWYDDCPGMDKLMTDEGRAWILAGLGHAATAATVTETDIDDLTVARIRAVIRDDKGWEGIKNILEIAMNAPDSVSETHGNATEATAQFLVDEVDIELSNINTDDPLTVLMIVFMCIKIANAIRERREQSRGERERVRRFYRDTEKRFARRVIRFDRRSQ